MDPSVAKANGASNGHYTSNKQSGRSADRRSMRFCIVGSGAVGGYYGAKLGPGRP